MSTMRYKMPGTGSKNMTMRENVGAANLEKLDDYRKLSQSAGSVRASWEGRRNPVIER